MEFIDNPQFGHKRNKLPIFLVPVLMFVVVIVGIIASKVYVDAVLHPVGESDGQSSD